MCDRACDLYEPIDVPYQWVLDDSTRISATYLATEILDDFPMNAYVMGPRLQSCQRHAGASVKGINQSAQDESGKDNQPKLSWVEESFQSIGQGTKGVDLESTSGSVLKYTVTSDQTLALWDV